MHFHDEIFRANAPADQGCVVDEDFAKAIMRAAQNLFIIRLFDAAARVCPGIQQDGRHKKVHKKHNGARKQAAGNVVKILRDAGFRIGDVPGQKLLRGNARLDVFALMKQDKPGDFL